MLFLEISFVVVYLSKEGGVKLLKDSEVKDVVLASASVDL